MNVLETRDYSNYNSLQLQLEKPLFPGSSLPGRLRLLKEARRPLLRAQEVGQGDDNGEEDVVHS
jgi:hypothetical protein